MSGFDESQHVRNEDGKFGEKPQSAPEVSLGTSELPAETQRLRRGHDFYPKNFNEWPPTYNTAVDVGPLNKEVLAHYFHPGGDWYVVEADQDGYAYGYSQLSSNPGGAEWGYISLPELEQIRTGFSIVERDIHMPEGARFRDMLPSLASQRNDVEKLPHGSKRVPVSAAVDKMRPELARDLSALDGGPGGALDLFVGTIEDGHLSRGTPGKSGANATRAWLKSAGDESANASLTPEQRDEARQFQYGLQEATARLFSDFDDDRVPFDSTSWAVRVDAAVQAAETKRASKAQRDSWRAALQQAPSGAHHRGMLVAAAAFSGTDEWWGFRDDTNRTMTGELQ